LGWAGLKFKFLGEEEEEAEDGGIRHGYFTIMGGMYMSLTLLLLP